MDNTEADREILLEHARHPKRVGEINDADGVGHCHNPLCGDKVAVSFMSREGILQSVRILPSGCSISTASASLMSEMVEGKSLQEIGEIIKLVHENFSPSQVHEPWPPSLRTLQPLKRIRESALKIPCVLISWVAMKEALKNYQSSGIVIPQE